MAEPETSNININVFDDLVGIINEREDGSEAHDRYLAEILRIHLTHHSHPGDSRHPEGFEPTGFRFTPE